MAILFSTSYNVTSFVLDIKVYRMVCRKSRKKKMKKILLSILIISNLFAQANRLLTLPPTAQVSSVGNVFLPFTNPARHTSQLDMVGFSRVNWMSNITDDMFYTHIGVKRQNFGFSMLAFNYGQQLETNDNGVVIGDFNPTSSVWAVSWGGGVKNYLVGVRAKIISHDLYSQKTLGTAFDISTYLPKVYKDLDLDLQLSNFGFAPTFNDYKTTLPTSINVGMTYPYKQWMFYEQHNFFKKFHTWGSGVSYNYNNMLWGKAGYYVDKSHDLRYGTFGVSMKYDKYLLNMSYIYGKEDNPLTNTIRLTINLEL